jgi:hypothetical protein
VNSRDSQVGFIVKQSRLIPAVRDGFAGKDVSMTTLYALIKRFLEALVPMPESNAWDDYKRARAMELAREDLRGQDAFQLRKF